MEPYAIADLALTRYEKKHGSAPHPYTLRRYVAALIRAERKRATQIAITVYEEREEAGIDCCSDTAYRIAQEVK